MTEREALKLALETAEGIVKSDWRKWQELASPDEFERWVKSRALHMATAIKEALAQPEQEPVAMKFKIYKPTAPDPVRQDINNALLPWVYDQDRSSGFDASMWVTPVATLPPQRKPLTDEQIADIVVEMNGNEPTALFWRDLARAIEAAHGIKGDA